MAPKIIGNRIKTAQFLRKQAGISSGPAALVGFRLSSCMRTPSTLMKKFDIGGMGGVCMVGSRLELGGDSQ